MALTFKKGMSCFKSVIPYSEYFHKYFFSKYFRNPRCNLCIDTTNELADISCGDAWLPEYDKDKVGTSIIVTRERDADQLLNKIVESGQMQVKPIGPKRIEKSQHLLSDRKFKKANLYLMQRLGKQVPKYNPSITPIASPILLYNISIYPGSKLALNKNLWAIFYIYSKAMKPIQSVLNRLRL